MSAARGRGMGPASWLAFALAVVEGASGCTALRSAPELDPEQVPVATAWPATAVAAYGELAAGRHERAQRALDEFAAAYPNTPEAMEASYWRAVVLLDPANAAGSAQEAATLLQHYMDSRHPLTHRTEAAVLRRIAASLAQASRPATGGRPAAGADPRDAEIQRLKEELEATKAELERIRKRLAPPPPSQPTRKSSSARA